MGFAYKTVAFTWVKSKTKSAGWHIGLGHWTRGNPEMFLLFTKGAPKRQSAAVRQIIVAQRHEHSRKPDEARDRIKQLLKGLYLELFARQPVNGWDVIGDQTDMFERKIRPVGLLPLFGGT